MKNKIFFSVMLLVLFVQQVLAQTKLPTHWYQAPEEINTKIEFEKDNQENEEAVKEEINKLLTANEAALKASHFYQDQQKGIFDDWQLDRFIFSLGVGLKGTLGLTTFGGKGAFEFHYLPINKDNKEIEVESNPMDIVLDKNLSQAALEKQVDRVSSLLYSTKKVKNKKNLQENLRHYAMEFLDFTVGLNHADTKGAWSVNGFEMLLSVEASGKVQPEIDVGGEIRVRLRWLKQGGNKSNEKAETILTNKQLQVRDFIVGLADDLTEVSSKSKFSDYQPRQLDLGLGFTAKGTIVMVKAKGEIEGRVILRHEPNKNLSNWKPQNPNGHIKLYDDYKENVVSYAEAHNIPFEVIQTATDKGFERKVIYQIGRKSMRKGMERTFKMAKFFHQLLNIRKMDEWEIREMKMRYDFSVEGVLPYVSIGGKAVSELTFNKI